MFRLWCLLTGYAFGMLHTAYFLGRAHGIDIRKYGSGNLGTTNVMRTLGKKWGILTFLGDFFKCAAAVLVSWAIFKGSHPDVVPLLTVYTGAGVILGHNFPCYLHFKGGKGIASSAGMYFMLSPVFCAIGFALYFVVFALTGYVSLGSISIYLYIFFGTVICGQNGILFHMTQPHLNEMYLIIGLLTAMAVWEHRGNISRLLQGTERRSSMFGHGGRKTKNS